MRIFLMRSIIIGTVLFLLSGVADAQTSGGGYYSRTWRVKDVIGEIGSEHTKILGITLLSDFLRDVVDKFGRTDVFKVGPGESADQMVCYISRDDADDTVIMFGLGWGSTERIDNFILTTKDYIPFLCEKCAKSALVKKGIATKGGITLGMTKKRFMAIFGKPTEIIEDDGIAYRYIRTFKFTDEEVKKLKLKLDKSEYPPYDVFIMSGIQAHFLHGKLVWFMVYESWS